MTRVCQACSQLSLKHSDFTAPPFQPENKVHVVVRSSTVGILRASQRECDLCHLIWYALERNYSTTLYTAEDDEVWRLEWTQSTDDYQPTEDYGIESLLGSALWPILGTGNHTRDYRIECVDEKSTNGFLRGRLVDSEIDIGMLKGWLQICREAHGESCTSPDLALRSLSDTTIQALTVIDVENLCLCQLPNETVYVTLSYVWGNINDPVNLRSNREDFAKPRGLSVKLPQTIQDAIKLVKALDFRFLWVDSLCLTQDDMQGMQAYVSNMDVIYSNAALTIVAATGDGADSGLSGISIKQGRDQNLVTLEHDLRLGVLPQYQRELLACHHASRAWTYQETCLSQRCLIFLNGFAYFNCNTAAFAEHVNAEVSGIKPEASANTLGKTNSEWPLRRYSEHVFSYSSRKLTYQSDGLNAFTGIANALSRRMGIREMLYGMPTSSFDWSLLWTGRGSLLRREGFPSWSWVGWVGEIHMSQDTYGAYDQNWLLKGTWIDWWIFDGKGECVPLWNSKDPINAVSPMVQQAVNALDVGRLDSSSAENEESESGDEDYEDEPCPTYGHSSNSNPFGRRIHEKALDLIDLQSGPLLECKLHVGSDPGLLMFCAPTLSTKAGPLLRIPPHLDFPVSPIFDKMERKCGFLSVCNHDSWPGTGDKIVQLIIVSVTSYGDLSSHLAFGHTAGIDTFYGVDEQALEEYMDTLPDDIDNFEFLNVLFVRETNRTATLSMNRGRHDITIHERVGVGFIHRQALCYLDNIKCRYIALN